MARQFKILKLEKELTADILSWIEKQGIDTFDEDFADAILVRLNNGEFNSVEEFFRDLQDFKNGERVGYG